MTKLAGQTIRVKLKSFDAKLLDKSVVKIVATTNRSGAKVAGPVPLPTKIEKFCVLRSPHVNKKSREQFEIRTHKRLIDIIERSFLNTQFLIEQKSIQFVNNIKDNFPISIDGELIERVFINLISNAVKYTPIDGSITIDANINTDSSLKISVTDTGPGIPENLKDRIFDKFTQIIAKKSGNTRSHGLGLTFCKYAIEAHKGIIGVDTKIGEGTSFWFTLPYQEDDFTERYSEGVAAKEKVKLNSVILKKVVPYIEKLGKKDVFEVSEIQMIIDELRNQNISEIDNWLKALENSLYSVNQNEFSKLLNHFA